MRKCLVDRLGYRCAVMSVDIIDDLPAIGFESCCSVISEPSADLTVDGNLVVVVEANELAEF